MSTPERFVTNQSREPTSTWLIVLPLWLKDVASASRWHRHNALPVLTLYRITTSVNGKIVRIIGRRRRSRILRRFSRPRAPIAAPAAVVQKLQAAAVVETAVRRRFHGVEMHVSADAAEVHVVLQRRMPPACPGDRYVPCYKQQRAGRKMPPACPGDRYVLCYGAERNPRGFRAATSVSISRASRGH